MITLSSIKQKADKLSLTKVTLMLVLVILFTATFLRISLLVLYPFMAALVFIMLRLRFTNYLLSLLIVITIGWLLSFSNGFFLKYNLLSLFYMLPFFALLFAEPGDSDISRQDLVRLFFYAFSIVAFINNIIGIVQVIVYPESDDNFTGIYSTFSLSVNGLAVLNSLLFIYYFFSFLAHKKKWHLPAAGFFLFCSIMGFYGAGLLVLVLAVSLGFFNVRFKSILKSLLAGIVLLIIIQGVLLVVKPKVLAYNKANLERAQHFNDTATPRKIVSFYNYVRAYPPHIKDFVFGSGPGTFNSRSAFMIGSPYFFTSVPAIKSEKKPPYFRDYAYTLWNNTNTSQALYQDGFRNQPFSSLLAFLGEYGLIFTSLFFIYLFLYYKKVVCNKPSVNMPPQYYLYTRLFKCFLIMLLLLMVVDNYFEYPEITLLITVALKLFHIEIKKIQPLY